MPESGRTAAGAPGFGPDPTRGVARIIFRVETVFDSGGARSSRASRAASATEKALTPSPTRRKDYLGLESADAGQYVPFGGLRGAARLVLVLTARRDVGGENLGGGDVLRCEREGVSVRFRRVVLAGKKRKSERTDAPCGSSAGGRRRTQPRPRRARRRARSAQGHAHDGHLAKYVRRRQESAMRESDWASAARAFSGSPSFGIAWSVIGLGFHVLP